MRVIGVLFFAFCFLFLSSPALAQESEDLEKLVTERYFEGAYNYYQEGQYEMAIKFYKIVLERDPNHAKALYWLARLYQELGLYREALSTWSRLAEVQPEDKVAKYFVKVCRGIIAEGKEAFETYEKAYELYSQGDKEKALALYERVCALKPDFQKAYYWAGRVALELGDYNKAEWYLENAVRLDKSDKISGYLLSQVRKRKK